MYSNAATIPMTLGGRYNGYMRLIMDAAVHANLSGTPYTRQTEPKPYATHGARNTAAEWSDVNINHKKEWHLYNLDDNIDNNHKQEVITAVEEKYLTAKKRRYMGLQSDMEKDLMGYCMKRYGKILASNIEACIQALVEPIEVDHPIDVYFHPV